jgi:chromosome segregation ATPase
LAELLQLEVPRKDPKQAEDHCKEILRGVFERSKQELEALLRSTLTEATAKEERLATINLEISSYEADYKKVRAEYKEYTATSFIIDARASQDEEEHEELLNKIKKIRKNIAEIKA